MSNNNNKRIYAFGYNGFGQTNPESQDAIISMAIDITEITNCNKIIWANFNSTLGEMRDVQGDDGKSSILWGFCQQLDEVTSLTFKPFKKNIKKCFGDDDGIQGFLDFDGNLYYLNLNSNQEEFISSNFSTKFIDIAQFWTGKDVIGITEDGKLMKWNLGSNSTPEEIIISSEEEKEEGGVIEKFFINVACGENHCLALTRDGEVFSWGSGRYGQLGHGNLISLDKSDKPKVIEFLQGLKITSIACGAWHSAVISDSGDLYTFGWNNLGRLGISPPPGNNNENNENTVNSAEPSLVEFQGDCNDDFINVVKVACGSAHTVVLTDDNNLLTCGWGKYGQQGQGPGNLSEIYSFTSVIEGKKVIDCYCGRWNTFAIVLE